MFELAAMRRFCLDLNVCVYRFSSLALIKQDLVASCRALDVLGWFQNTRRPRLQRPFRQNEQGHRR